MAFEMTCSSFWVRSCEGVSPVPPLKLTGQFAKLSSFRMPSDLVYVPYFKLISKSRSQIRRKKKIAVLQHLRWGGGGGSRSWKIGDFQKKALRSVTQKKILPLALQRPSGACGELQKGFPSGACGGLIISVYFCIRRGLCFKKFSPAAPFNLIFLSEKNFACGAL